MPPRVSHVGNSHEGFGVFDTDLGSWWYDFQQLSQQHMYRQMRLGDRNDVLSHFTASVLQLSC